MCGNNIEKRPESQVKLHRIIIKVHKIICSTCTKTSTPAIFLTNTKLLRLHTTHTTEEVVCRCYSKQVFLELSREFHRKTLALESLFHKVAGLKDCKFIKRRLQHRCFPVKFPKFLRTAIFTEHLRWLLLTRPMPLTLFSRLVKLMLIRKENGFTPAELHHRYFR